MMRPTRRAVLIFAAGFPLSLLLLAYAPDAWQLVFAYGGTVLLALLADALASLQSRRLRLDILTPERIAIGDGGAVTVGLAAEGQVQPTAIELLIDRRGDLDEAEIVTAQLVAGEPVRVALPLVPRRRGRILVDRLWLRWQGRLGLVQLTRSTAIDRAVDVIPNLHGVQSAAIQFFSRAAIYGSKVQPQRGAGTEFESLRDYAPGLDHRFIDWKHSARHRKLLCQEFQVERNQQIVLAFDTGYLMREPLDGMPRLDHAINAGLLLAWISLRSGDIVGTYGFDAAIRHYQQPLRGLSGFARIQHAAAALDYHAEETNFTLGLAGLAARLKHRALVILFTEFVDTVTAELLIESLQRLASRHLVIFVTLRDSLLQGVVDAMPESFEDVARAVVAHDLLRDRAIVLERLQRLGIHCLDVASRGLSVGLINRYLFVKQRGLL